jgi:hypothetical protein
VTLQKYFSCASLIIYCFCNAAHKTETGTANMWELLIANHLDQSLLGLATDQKEEASSSQSDRIYLLQSSQPGAQLCCAFYEA